VLGIRVRVKIAEVHRFDGLCQRKQVWVAPGVGDVPWRLRAEAFAYFLCRRSSCCAEASGNRYETNGQYFAIHPAP
jgi:hypothetical protein